MKIMEVVKLSSVDIQMPPKLIPLFTQKGLRYLTSKGGRGSGKTVSFAKMTAVVGYMAAEQGINGVILSAREHLNSLSESSMEEIKDAIRSEPFLNDYYELGENYIRTKNRRVSYVFAGLRHNLDSIKSKARILLCWVDEAESVSEMAWQKLLPTVRSEGSQIYITYNPERKDSPTNVRFGDEFIYDDETGELIGMCVEMNYADNPWFPHVLDLERRRDMKNLSPERYNWIWNGAYLQNSESQIFAKKYIVADFTPDYTWDGPYHGLDFGFSTDPMAFVKCWINDQKLYIEYDCSGVGIENDEMVEFITSKVPNANATTTRADNSRPETISYLRRHGMPNVVACEKGKGSVEDGIEFMRSFDTIVIHTRCKGTKEEFDKYSYKVDRLTGEVLTIIVDKWNHHIDAIRYALEPIMKSQGNFLDLL